MLDEEGDIVGQVKGTDYEPYEVLLKVVTRSKRPYIESYCACPYDRQCKHGAAVALYGLSQSFSSTAPVLDGSDRALKALAVPIPLVSLDVAVPSEVAEWLNRVAGAAEDTNTFDPDDKARLMYTLDVRASANSGDVPFVTPFTRNVLKAGGFGSQLELKPEAIGSGHLPKHINSHDRALLTDLDRNTSKFDWNRAQYRLDGPHGLRLLTAVLESGRCYWKAFEYNTVLKVGQARTGHVKWIENGKQGMMKPSIDFGGRGAVLPTSPPWYVDIDSRESGPIASELSPETATALLRTSPIRPEFLPAVRTALAATGIDPAALPVDKHQVVVRAPQVTPCLTIRFEVCKRRSHQWNAPEVSAPIAFADLTFEYDGQKAPASEDDIRIVEPDEILILRRNSLAEEAASDLLKAAGWRDPAYAGWNIPQARAKSLCLVPSDDYQLHEPIEQVNKFVEKLFPKLVEAGWKVDVEQRYRFVPDEDVEWDLGLNDSSGIDWFEVQVGIRVEGQALDLKDVLRKHLSERLGYRSGASGRLKQADDMYVFTPDGRTIRLSRKRLDSIVDPLIELFGGIQDWPTELRLPRALLNETEKFEDTMIEHGLPWRTSEELKGLSQRLTAFDHLEPANEPEGFIGELRNYQKEGLAWLQFLREYSFGGILADDMGLGKTVQVLALLQAEKNAGRMDRPCLIVAPTSTIPNWRRESERFTPGLNVVTLQGAGRHGRFSDLSGCDIALTTYPLLARDKDRLLKSTYHVIVLDEAQNVKNPVTNAARAARELSGRHKLCMSGTPIENHLGELWSLFHFVMPGFLGSDGEFKKRFRSPIEKSGDNEARERLTRRVRPFMLRRTKDKVVKELPPKTEIIESVAFEEPQRDLYESIRAAMDEQVRTLIAAQGFEKSRIQILDALLKLRQVCCDPRLVKLPSARKVTASAKLDRLIEMLTVLFEEGRHVLLFSQFTSMLDLIQERLKAADMKWVRISGDTIDRDTPVRQFQAGEVPLFLISLKAGGTGLNLTAADTVILYDPWWNPAVENQAIDRAHRIGQDKPVMVYRLVAEGTIEEKMLQMQARKGELARSVLSDDVDVVRTLTADDLKWVLSKD